MQGELERTSHIEFEDKEIKEGRDSSFQGLLYKKGGKKREREREIAFLATKGRI